MNFSENSVFFANFANIKVDVVIDKYEEDKNYMYHF